MASARERELLDKLARMELETQQANRQAEQERLRAEQANQRADKAEATTQPTTLEELLEHCHNELFQQFEIQADKTLTTQGDVTSPIGRIYPRRLRIWTDFPALQQQAFDKYYAPLHPEGSSHNAKRIFIDAHAIRSNGELNLKGRKISSEDDLRLFESTAVANMVRAVIDRLSADKELRNTLGLDAGASVSFENHANALNAGNVELEARLLPKPLNPTSDDQAGKLANIFQAQQPPTTPAPTATTQYDQGERLTKADNYCVYHAEGQHRKLLYAVEFKAPHKVTKEMLRTGLHEMDLSKDVINRPTIPGDKDLAGLFKYHAERITAAVLTQTYQYMIETGCEYSCVSTGEAIVFLWVPAHLPSELHYHLAEPGLEVGEGKGLQHNRTTIAQTLSFIFMALQTETRDRDWRDKAKKVAGDGWEIDVSKILSAIPETLRKSPPESPAWKPTNFPDDVKRTSKYFTRRLAKEGKKKQLFTSHDHKPRDTPRHDDEDSDDEDGPGGKPGAGKGFPATPTPDPATRQSRRGKQSNWQKSDHNDHQHRAYCTQQCLLGLTQGSALDAACPHFEAHRKNGRSHHRISAEQLCVSLQQQLGRRLAYNCTDLQIYGSRCMMFKVSTAAYGYTFIAKGTIGGFIPHLQHEAQVYHRLRKLQGHDIPVYLGNIDLAKPILDFGGVEIVHMLLLAYGGKRLADGEVGKPSDFRLQVKSFKKKLERFGLEHGDLEERNMLWNAEVKRIMFIDFERSKSVPRTRALQEITPNRQCLEADTSNESPRAKSQLFEIFEDNPMPSSKKDCAELRKGYVGTQTLMSDLIQLDEDLMIAQLWSEAKENVAPATTAPTLIDNGKSGGPFTPIQVKQALAVSPTKDDKPYSKLSKDRAVKQPTEDEDDKENTLPIDVT
ncbi:MAG: hypothetical protein LQ346_004017 [Caloplaca aetnensis]|nr:MAG: hypothetical protein LQ346_004017 [Caloplaca aetnensis]